MTTLQILTAAYADIFGIEPKENGSYYDQKAGESLIDYAHFDDNYVKLFDLDTDYIEAVTEDGSEGCWIGVFRVRYNDETRRYDRDRVGTIKTLNEGRTAWKDMGALAGELAYVANNVTAWKLYRESKKS